MQIVEDKALLFRSDILNLHQLGDASLEELLERLENNELDDYSDIGTLIGERPGSHHQSVFAAPAAICWEHGHPHAGPPSEWVVGLARRGGQAAAEEEIAAGDCGPVRVLEMRVDADADALLIGRRGGVAHLQHRIMGVFFPAHAVQIEHGMAAGFAADVGPETGFFEDLRDRANFCIIGVE